MARTAQKGAAGGKRKGGAGAKGRGAALRANARDDEATQPAPLLDGGAGRDIAGVALAVAAVASLIAVMAPASAPVTQAVSGFYHLGFGLGGYVLPLVLLALSACLFLRPGAPVSPRAAAGGSLIFIAACALLSLFAPGSDGSTEPMFAPVNLVATGGYLGAFLASALQGALGKPIAAVICVGAALLGLVVIGFSVSEALQALAARVRRVADRPRVDVNQRPWGDAEAASGASSALTRRMPRAGQASLFDGAAASETTYLGARETTVIGDDEDDDDPFVDVSGDVEAERARTRLIPVRDRFAKRGRGAAGKGGDEKGDEKARPSDEPAAAGEDGSSPAPSKDEPSTGHHMATPSEEDVRALLADDERAPWEDPASSAAAGSKAAPTVLDAATGAQAPIPAFLAGSSGAARPPVQEAPAPKAVPAPKAPVTPATGSSDADGAERQLPPATMLRHAPRQVKSSAQAKELEQTAASLQSTLQEFGLRSSVVGWIAGPTVTTFKVQPGEGERVSRINSLEDDIALTLATDSVRIFAPIPGTSLVGIEIPNRTRQTVEFGDILPYVKGGPLEFALGRDAEGSPMVADLAKMPHLLIAGTTGSGKSVVISSIVMSLLMRTFPEDVRLIMIDPKRVEFAPYDGLPHLYVPVVTEPKQAASALQWAVSEMERRLKIFERIGVRKISTFNEKQAAGEFGKYDNPPAKMPYLVIVIDELSDLMMVAGKDVEASIVRIAQLGRAAGIHMIVATQRPSSNVVTGLIKANITNRIGLTVATGIDSRVILDQNGAEKLTGQGDMLFSRVDWGKPKRIQGCYVSDEEIAEVVGFVKEHSQAEYHEEILSAVAPAAMGGGAGAGSAEPAEDDPLLWDAARIVVDSQLGSTSGLQRRLKVGYARAGRIMDMLEEKGVVGPPDGSKPREVLLDMEGLQALEALESPLTDEEIGGGF